MATSDLDQLIDMGFDKEKAQMAVKKTGGCKQSPTYLMTLTDSFIVSDAIEWLDQNADKSVEQLKADDAAEAEAKAKDSVEQAKSLLCNDCGKRFRGQAAAEYHASKTEHTNFSESTEEIAPLTEEEKKAKLDALRDKLAAKKAVEGEQDKLDRKRNEEISKKKTKESQDIKEQLKVKEQIKDAEKKRKEKQADIEAKKKIQAKIAVDKEERRLRAEREKAERAGVAPPPEPVAAPVVSAPSKPASEYKETRLRLQTSGGNIMKTFPVDTTLFEVAAAISEETGRDVESFTQNFPRKIFNNEFFGETLKDLKMVPSASLIVK